MDIQSAALPADLWDRSRDTHDRLSCDRGGRGGVLSVGAVLHGLRHISLPNANV